MSENGKPSGLTLKWLHLVVILFIQVLLLGSIYGSLKYQVEENERRILKLEEATQGFREIKEEISRRLDKLETKLDVVITNLNKH